MIDCIVVGSGLAGANAAQSLVDANLKVLMLDVGVLKKKQSYSINNESFVDFREKSKNQADVFLGKKYEGIPFDNAKIGGQLSPSRKYILEKCNELIPLASRSFTGMESLAYGGLGNAWGTGCNVFSAEECKKAGLPETEMQQAYQVIADRIGISSQKDDASPYGMGHITGIQKPIKMDRIQSAIFARYATKKKNCIKNGFYFGRTALAVLTEKKGNRNANPLNDMDFYTDESLSAYRPWITIRELKKNPLFSYTNNCLVEQFLESENEITIQYKDLTSNAVCSIKGKNIMLCASALGSARIVMKSLANKAKKLPFLCNPYFYIPCINWPSLGEIAEKKSCSLGQMAAYYDPKGDNIDASMGVFYTYRSLMLMRIIKESPLGFRSGRILLQSLQSAFTIAGIHLPESSDNAGHIELMDSVLHLHYNPSDGRKKEIKTLLKKWKWFLKRMKLFPIKVLQPQMGASIHYAGTLAPIKGNTLYTQKNGQLTGFSKVWIGDASGFAHLPAKGLSLSIMANAHRVAENIKKTISS